MKKISQREARLLRKRLDALERDINARLNRWTSDYPGGVNITTITLHERDEAIVNTAMALGHAVILKHERNQTFRVHAMQPVRP